MWSCVLHCGLISCAPCLVGGFVGVCVFLLPLNLYRYSSFLTWSCKWMVWFSPTLMHTSTCIYHMPCAHVYTNIHTCVHKHLHTCAASWSIREWVFFPNGDGEAWRRAGSIWVYWEEPPIRWTPYQPHVQTGEERERERERERFSSFHVDCGWVIISPWKRHPSSRHKGKQFGTLISMYMYHTCVCVCVNYLISGARILLLTSTANNSQVSMVLICLYKVYPSSVTNSSLSWMARLVGGYPLVYAITKCTHTKHVLVGLCCLFLSCLFLPRACVYTCHITSGWEHYCWQEVHSEAHRLWQCSVHGTREEIQHILWYTWILLTRSPTRKQVCDKVRLWYG